VAILTLEDVLAAARAVAAAARGGSAPLPLARALRDGAAAARRHVLLTGAPHPAWGDGGLISAARRMARRAGPAGRIGQTEFLRAAAAVCQALSEDASDPLRPAECGPRDASV
jgi:hypothetical protein